jgi:hypothetical protein
VGPTKREGSALFESRTREVFLRLEQGVPASFAKALQYPHPKPLQYRAPFVHPAVGSDGERFSALQIAFGVIFERQVFFVAGLQLLMVVLHTYHPIDAFVAQGYFLGRAVHCPEALRLRIKSLTLISSWSKPPLLVSE